MKNQNVNTSAKRNTLAATVVSMAANGETVTPAHRFPETETEMPVAQIYENLKEKERESDIKGAAKNQGRERKAKGASIRADIREVAMSFDEINSAFGKENKTRANLIKRKEREMKARNEKNVSDYVAIGKALRGFQIQAEYQKEGQTLINNSVLESVLESFDLSHYSRGQRRAYIVVYQRETELDALEAWRQSVAKTRIKPLHELDPDSIRSAFDKFDKAQQSASDTDSSDTDSSDTDSSKKDTLEKLLANIVTRANALGIEKKTLIAELNKREF